MDSEGGKECSTCSMADKGISEAEDPRYHKYEKYLSDGWVPGRKVDVTDAQYHTFRENLPYMASLLLLHPLLRKAWNTFNPIQKRTKEGTPRLAQRATFDFSFAILFLLVLHGFSAFKVLLILRLNYMIATKLPRNYVPAATWAFNIPVLFANELCQGYHYKSIAQNIMPPLESWGEWLDGYGGLLARWEVLFNITILRLVSFNMDYYWSIDKNRSNSLEVSSVNPYPVYQFLIRQRRSNWTRHSSRNETESRYRLTHRITPFETTWRTPSTHPRTSPVPL